jgi:TetR/AcrR family transcriptional regulator, lmrAB and yxaGH operons repressor
MGSNTRKRMLEATATLVQQRGYHGTSLNDVLEASRAPRGSLYFHFPGGKDQLVIEAVRTAVDEVTRELRDTLAAAKDPAAGVRAFLEGTAQLLEESDYAFGCPVAGVVLDATPTGRALAELCRDALDEWMALLRDAFVAAGVAEARASGLALLVESVVEGVLLIARARRDADAVRAVAVELETTVAAALPSGR